MRRDPGRGDTIGRAGGKLSQLFPEKDVDLTVGRDPDFLDGRTVDSERIVWTTAVTDSPAHSRGRAAGTRATSRYTFSGCHILLDQDGCPATAPPWGALTVVDINTGKLLWRVRFGECPELAAKGITNTGSENYGSGVATASGSS